MPKINIPDLQNEELSLPRLDAGVYDVNIMEKPTVGQSDSGKDYVLVTMSVTGGPDQMCPNPLQNGDHSPIGLKVVDYVYFNAKFNIKALFVAAGILDRADKDSAKAQGSLDTDELMGAKFAIKVIKKIYNEKETLKVKYLV